MSEPQHVKVEQADAVATVTFLPFPKRVSGSLHAELAAALERIRSDHGVRVVVLTGSDGNFLVPPPADAYDDPEAHDLAKRSDPSSVWQIFNGIVRCHHAIAEMEKPVIAKINGDAIGFGASIAFAADMTVAVEDARFMDHHMGGSFTTQYGDRVRPGGHPEFSVPPGDGGALMSLFMTPSRMKEYLMLCKSYDARELARVGAVNYAVPAGSLDAKVDELVAALLERGAHALAWAKRSVNRHVVSQMNVSLDASVGYEMAAVYQLALTGGEEPKTLL